MSRPRRVLKIKYALAPILALVAGVFFFDFSWLWPEPVLYYSLAQVDQETPPPIAATAPVFRVTHLPTPEPVRALYLTSWVAGTPALRARLVKLVENTEINSLVIDIKDYSGHLAFAVSDPQLVAVGSAESRIKDIREFIGELHQKGIYVIGRIAVFQDAFLVDKRPELAVRRASDGGVWRDRKGIPWLDPAAREVWDYTILISRESYALGFDEINFDYIRFPSDGNMKDIAYSFFDKQVNTRETAMRAFYEYLDRGLSDLPLPISIDLFGLTTSAADDLGIGQKLESAAPYFDYIAPMVYPSHFAAGHLGFSNPAGKPYEVVRNAMDRAIEKLTATSSVMSAASSTLPAVPRRRRGELRPWLQDFDLGADYTAELIRAQKQAVYDSGLTSWMLWDPANRYTASALDI